MGEYLAGADVEDDVAELAVPPQGRELDEGGARMLLGRMAEARRRGGPVDDHLAHPLGAAGRGPTTTDQTRGRAASPPGYLEAQRGRRPTPHRVYLESSEEDDVGFSFLAQGFLRSSR